MDISKLPRLQHAKVFHVGTLDASQKGGRGPSYEGAGLSVSRNPEAWKAISKLGGFPTWVLHRSDGKKGRFVDFHRMSPSDFEAVSAEGLKRGWLSTASRHRLSWVDPDDDGETRYSLFGSAEKAEVERDDIAEWALNAAVTEVTMHVGTTALRQAVRQTVEDDLAVTMVLTELVNECSELDGVWWTDRLDEFSLSAPRGVISLRALSSWEQRIVSQ